MLGGLVILGTSVVGWAREQEAEKSEVSFGLLVGSLLVMVPLVIAVPTYRVRVTSPGSTSRGLVAGSLGLFLLGMSCRP